VTEAAPKLSSRQKLVYLLSVGAISLALLTAGVLVLVARPNSGSLSGRPDVPPVIATTPPFEATRQDGTAFTERSLEGKVWVANFVFTRCPNICPTFSAKMAGLQAISGRRLPSLQLVSFTVDPEYDTPAVLTEYAQKYQADPARWAFVTAPVEVLEKTISKGLLQALDRGDGKDLKTLAHSSYFVLVDKHLRVRGFYRFNESTAVEYLMHDAEALTREP
jgi:protein SCO1/2